MLGVLERKNSAAGSIAQCPHCWNGFYFCCLLCGIFCVAQFWWGSVPFFYCLTAKLLCSCDKQKTRTCVPVLCGGPEETRTPHLCNANAALYQMSYWPSIVFECRPFGCCSLCHRVCFSVDWRAHRFRYNTMVLCVGQIDVVLVVPPEGIEPPSYP